MVTAAAAKPGKKNEALLLELPFDPEAEAGFTRADLVFSGVDHSAESCEVRSFLDNPTAEATTPRAPEAGYAGRFRVFGHGGCYGDLGHCDVPPPSPDPTDLRPAHPLTPITTYRRAPAASLPGRSAPDGHPRAGVRHSEPP